MAEFTLDRRRSVLVCAHALALLFVLFAKDARAQLHWDASAQAGVMKRFLTQRTTTGDAGFGPTAQLTGHVALLPLVHLGGYFGHDISPLPADAAARNITFGGLRAKAMLPWIRGTLRAWLFAGFGYAGVYAPSYATVLTIPDGVGGEDRKAGRVQGSHGGFFDVPFGIGASYKLFKPWELCVELGARAAFGHTGDAYEQPGPRVNVSGLPNRNVAPAGLDRFALGMTLGVLIDL